MSSPEDTKRGTIRSFIWDSSAEQDFPPTPKRRCLGEPDVKVVIGGQTFHHHSFILCMASDYFDAMLSSGMQESHNMRIEFPDKDPEEWKLVYPFLMPRSLSTAVNVKVTKENAKALLPWFHEFGMNSLLVESDDKLWSALLLFKHGYFPSEHKTIDERKSVIEEIVEWAAFADTYGLAKTRGAMMREIKKAITDYPEIVSKVFIQGTQAFWNNPTDSDIWAAMKARLPASVKSDSRDAELQSNPLIFDYLSQSFELAGLKNKIASSTSRDPRDEDTEDDVMFNPFRVRNRLREARERLAGGVELPLHVPDYARDRAARRLAWRRQLQRDRENRRAPLAPLPFARPPADPILPARVEHQNANLDRDEII